MVSKNCLERNATVIPKLLNNHGNVLDGAVNTVDLATAENKLLGGELVDRLNGIEKNIIWSNQDLAYSEGIGGSPSVRGLMAKLINDNFHPKTKVETSHIVLSAGGCFGLQTLMQDLCEEGDAVLIAAPYWPGLDLWISINNTTKTIPIQVPLDVFFETDSVHYYEEALKTAQVPVKAVLVCNPHNPLGKNYPKATLQAMFDFCARNNLHYVSDEVYALSQHAGSTTPFVSALSLDVDKAPGLVHVLYSLSKDFGCNGVRMGAFISQSNREVVLSGALRTFCQVSTMAAVISTQVILSDGYVHYTKTVGQKLLRNAYERVKAFLQQRDVEFMPADSGMFVFARLCSATQENKFKECLKEKGVVISAGTDYHFAAHGWFRICYACDQDQLTLGLERISDCMQLCTTAK